MRIAALALVAAAALVLTGCTPGAHPSATPSPKATPVFRSDAEALAAAEKAYDAYTASSNSIAKGGWQDVTAFSTYETGSALEEDEESAAKFSKRGLRQIGDASFDSFRLEQRSRNHPEVVKVYLCLDVSKVDVVDANGVSVVPSSRVSRNPLDVTFVAKDRSRVTISESGIWSGSNFC